MSYVNSGAASKDRVTESSMNAAKSREAFEHNTKPEWSNMMLKQTANTAGVK